MHKPLIISVVCFLFIPNFEDLPMLGHLGLQHLCYNYPVNLSACIFGSVSSTSQLLAI